MIPLRPPVGYFTVFFQHKNIDAGPGSVSSRCRKSIQQSASIPPLNGNAANNLKVKQYFGLKTQLITAWL
jgi:hypothetical protein